MSRRARTRYPHENVFFLGRGRNGWVFERAIIRNVIISDSVVALARDA